MRLLIDENMSGWQLGAVLRLVGQDVLMSDEANLTSVSDVQVVARAIAEGRVVLTRDYEDFLEIHDLIEIAGGHHPGILIVRFDPNRRQALSDRAIGTAISRLEASGVPIADRVHILNHWR